MLNLIAISYENIGPFKDKKISIFFRKGNYLIKAPIGTGKSFLFFDGPTYALYKNASRNILNIQSKSGYIKLLFQVNGQDYLIVRNLKQGKSKDSTSSHLYLCELISGEDGSFPIIENNSPIVYNEDIEALLKKQGTKLEEIVFKNETDLQQQLNSLILPQEVFESTMFLLQDAQNIFEMQPAERLEVLKHVFGLLGIDESKEQIKEKRNEIKYQIKAYQDISNYEEKLHNYLEILQKTFHNLKENNLSKDLLGETEKYMDEIENFSDKLSINNFSLDEDMKSFIPKLENKINEIQEYYQKQVAEQGVLKNQLSEINDQTSKIMSRINIENQKLKGIESLLIEVNPILLEELKEKKMNLQKEQGELESKSQEENFKDFFLKNEKKLGLQERSNFSLRMNQQFVQELITLGTKLKSEIELIDKKIEYNQEKESLQKKSLNDKISTLEEKYQLLKNQIGDYDRKIASFDENIIEEEKFTCGKINENCPFIRVIKKQHFDQRDQEKKILLEGKRMLEEKIKNESFETQIKDIKDQLKTIDFSEEGKKLNQEKRDNEECMILVKEFLQKIDYKQINALMQQRESNETQLVNIDNKIKENEMLLKNQDQYKQEKIQTELLLNQLDDQVKSYKKQTQELEGKIIALGKLIEEKPEEDIQKANSNLRIYQQTYNSLEILISEYNQAQLNLKNLIEREQVLSNIYSILNKELLLFVLGEYLPILSEIINNYLSSVVDYQVDIRLKENTEKLELETKILDEKGERDVKSLSSGQKTILKLVWMLSISSYLKTEMLFLDETINNMDVETVGKVAQLITDFVQQRKMKFYTITHNTEIQSMGIRDKILEVNK